MSSSGMKKTTGKKRSTSAAAAGTGTAGGLKRIHGDWQRLSVNERQLEVLRRDGFLPPLEKMATRVPAMRWPLIPVMVSASASSTL